MVQVATSALHVVVEVMLNSARRRGMASDVNVKVLVGDAKPPTKRFEAFDLVMSRPQMRLQPIDPFGLATEENPAKDADLHVFPRLCGETVGISRGRGPSTATVVGLFTGSS
jgi:hypothetical protein